MRRQILAGILAFAFTILLRADSAESRNGVFEAVLLEVVRIADSDMAFVALHVDGRPTDLPKAVLDALERHRAIRPISECDYASGTPRLKGTEKPGVVCWVAEEIEWDSKQEALVDFGYHRSPVSAMVGTARCRFEAGRWIVSVSELKASS